MPKQSPSYVTLTPGEPAPWFQQASSAGPKLVFHTLAGRYLVLCFYGSAADPRGRLALDTMQARKDLLDDRRVSFFGVSADPADRRESRVPLGLPGLHYVWDDDLSVSRLFGAAPHDAVRGRGPIPLQRFWMVIDPTLRIRQIVPFERDGGEGPAVMEAIAGLPSPERFAGVELQAPILYLPDVFEPEFCRRLIDLYEAAGGEDSGFMRDVEGKTVRILDHGFKRRRDCNVEDAELLRQIDARIVRRICPEVLKVHAFRATRIERYTVGCYAADEGGHFKPHRDNTSKGTEHRQFAVSINLNDGFEGGALCFPEYGPRTFTPPPGGAVVFSCGLLHAVTKVTRGRRYAFIPFLYDDASAALREANNRFLGPGVEAFQPR